MTPVSRVAPVVLIAVLLGSVVGLQALHERNGGPPAGTGVDVLYVRSPEAREIFMRHGFKVLVPARSDG